MLEIHPFVACAEGRLGHPAGDRADAALEDLADIDSFCRIK